MRRSSLTRGFTLIELLVVLVIIGILAALVVPSVLDRAEDARVTAARTDVNNLMQALKLYKLDNQRYPSAEQGLDALVHKPTAGTPPPNWKPYLDKLPNPLVSPLSSTINLLDKLLNHLVSPLSSILNLLGKLVSLKHN